MRNLALAAVGLLLAACAPTLQRNAAEPAVYMLAAPAPAPAPEPGQALAADLQVLRPVVAPVLRTERIATRWGGNRIDYYADARWGGELGAVVQAALVDGTRAAGRFRTVEADPGHFKATHVLGVEVTRFEADYTAGDVPVARVALTATVARQQDRRALAAWTVAAEQPAEANTLSAVTAALGHAFDRAARDIVNGTGEAVATDLSGQP